MKALETKQKTQTAELSARAGSVDSERNNNHPKPDLPPAQLVRDSRLKRPITSKRSGGPRTAEGRARSSLNAIKHGGYVTARSAALDFQQTLSELISRVNPFGHVEEALVHSLACEIFRLSMLGKLEVERVQAAVHSEVSLMELAHALDYPWLQSHPHDLRDPAKPSALKARLFCFFSSQLNSLVAQSGPNPSDADRLTIRALELATQDLECGEAEHSDCPDEDTSGENGDAESVYLGDLDRHVRALASGQDLVSRGMGLPCDTQPLVDYWIFRNRHRIEATRRDLQVAQMLMILTNENVRRARGQAVRQLDDCIRLIELLKGRPVDLGSSHRRELGSST